MKRRLFFLLPLFLLLLTLPVGAEEAKGTPSLDLAETETELREGILALLPDAAKEHLREPTDAEAVQDALGFRALLSLVIDAVKGKSNVLVKTVFRFLGITLLFAALSRLIKGSAVSTVMQSAAALSYFLLLSDVLDRTFIFFSDLAKFTAGVSPLYVTLFAAGGGTARAGAASVGISSFLSLLELFSTTLLPPLLHTLLALSLLGALGNHTLIRELSRRLSAVAVFFFSLLSMLLTASLAFQTLLASSADSVALRTVKYTASSSIPYVGGTLAGTLGALQASLSLFRGALGGSAVVALLTLLLPPLLEVLLLRFALSLSESLAAFTEADALSSVIGRFRGVFDLLLAALVTVSLLFILLVGVLAGGSMSV